MEDNGVKIKVRRGNTSLFVPEIDKQRYLDMGYNVITTSGQIIEKATAKDVPTLLARCNELEAENKALKEQLNEVKNKLDELSKAPVKATKTTKKKSE